MNHTPIKIKNLSHRYRSNETEELSLRSLNLTLEQGELVGLLGPSGCGKTTLLRLIAGFERPLKGNIFINNHINNFNKKLPYNYLFFINLIIRYLKKNYVKNY